MTARVFWTFAALFTLCGSAPASDALIGGYWGNFKQFWIASVQKQNGVLLALLGFGIVCIFIITRSKAKK